MKKILLLVALTAALSACCNCRSYEKKYYTPFEATRWSLQQLDGRNVASSVEADRIPYLVFGNDGRFSGSGGCNRIGGEYERTQSQVEYKKDNAGTLTFSNSFSTKMYCPNDALERRFLELLGNVDAFAVEGEYLYLFHDGELRAVLVKAKAE